jgi:hypothetical protein
LETEWFSDWNNFSGWNKWKRDQERWTLMPGVFLEDGDCLDGCLVAARM